MAHLVEQMAFVDQLPWHGLGFKMLPGASIEEWQQNAGLNWMVEKRPVVFRTGEGWTAYKNRSVLVRNTDQRPFAIVADRYKIVQPKEILEFYRDLMSMHGMSIETAGSLKDGSRIWALAKTGDVHKVLGKDRVDAYLLLATSYDAAFSTLAQFTTVRVVCNNTLEMSFNNFSGRVSIPHSRTFDASAVKAEMGIGADAWHAFVEASELMAKAKVSTFEGEKFIYDLFKVDTGKTEQDMTPAEHVEAQHASNVIQMFKSNAPAAQLAGRTAWGLVNAVTGYVDHIKRARGQAGRLDSAWFGSGATLKREAMKKAMEIAA